MVTSAIWRDPRVLNSPGRGHHLPACVSLSTAAACPGGYAGGRGPCMEPVRMCSRCGKTCHPSRKVARRTARRGSLRTRLRPRRCPVGHGWHLSAHWAARPYRGARRRPLRDCRAVVRRPVTGAAVLPADRRSLSAVGGKLEAVLAGEIAAFYDREMPRLVLSVKALSSSLDGHAAADIAQTAYERALPRWPALRHPKAWLYKVACSEAIARAAAIAREMPAETLPDRPDPMPAALAAEWRAEQRDVMACLQALAPKQREVMTWTLAGFRDAEIGEALGLSADAVKQRRRDAKKNLQNGSQHERTHDDQAFPGPVQFPRRW